MRKTYTDDSGYKERNSSLSWKYFQRRKSSSSRSQNFLITSLSVNFVTWSSYYLQGHPKRAILRDILPNFGLNLKLQRLYCEMKDMLDLVDS